MRNSITLYEDQYQFYKELKSKRLMIAFVEYMFEDIEPTWLNWIEKVVRNSLKIRMENQKKKSDAWRQSHWGWRKKKESNSSSELDHENNTTNNKTNNTITTEQTTKKQEVKDNNTNVLLLEEKENNKKKGYWEFKKCLLTEKEYEQVMKDYWTRNWEVLINQVDNYCASKWKAYKNYLATIRNFAKSAWINKLQPVIAQNETWIYDLPF